MTKETNIRKRSHHNRIQRLLVIEATERPESRWHRIGVVFAHDDGEGQTLILDSLRFNFDGRIVMRAPKPNREEPMQLFTRRFMATTAAGKPAASFPATR